MSIPTLTHQDFHIRFMNWYDQRADKLVCRQIWEEGLQQVFVEMHRSEIFEIYLQTVCKLLDLYDPSMVTSESLADLSEEDLDKRGNLCSLQSTQHSFDSFWHAAGINHEPLD